MPMHVSDSPFIYSYYEKREIRALCNVWGAYMLIRRLIRREEFYGDYIFN